MFKDSLVALAIVLFVTFLAGGMYQFQKYVKSKECAEYAAIEKVETKMLTDVCYVKDNRNGWMKLESYFVQKTQNTVVIED